MYFLIVFFMLALSVAVLFLAKSYPLLKPVAALLPIVAVLILIFKPGSPDELPVSKQVLNAEAKGIGEQLAHVITRTIPQTGVILVIHPHENTSAYSQNRIPEQLQGLGDTLESAGYTLKTHGLVESDAANDPLTDGTYVGSPTLNKLAAAQPQTVGIVLLGLYYAIGDEQSDASLPPLVLASIGDPGTAELALAKGYAVAALFEKIEAPLSSIQDPNLTVEERFNRRFELRTSNP